jgi:hypothetical protein
MIKHLIFWHKTVNPRKNVPEPEKIYIGAKKYLPAKSYLLGSYAGSASV